jgi:hypothetical protein
MIVYTGVVCNIFHCRRQLAYAETAIAQARLAGILPDRIVNCWPVERLLAWLSDPLQSVSFARHSELEDNR